MEEQLLEKLLEQKNPLLSLLISYNHQLPLICYSVRNNLLISSPLLSVTHKPARQSHLLDLDYHSTIKSLNISFFPAQLIASLGLDTSDNMSASKLVTIFGATGEYQAYLALCSAQSESCWIASMRFSHSQIE